jgi:hypothetical protein
MVKWCRDAYEYHQCVLSVITNCSTRNIAVDIEQLTVFLDYVEKLANRECPGGLAGCAQSNSHDRSCLDRISYFLEKNARTNHARCRQESFIHRYLMLILFYWHS